MLTDIISSQNGCHSHQTRIFQYFMFFCNARKFNNYLFPKCLFHPNASNLLCFRISHKTTQKNMYPFSIITHKIYLYSIFYVNLHNYFIFLSHLVCFRYYQPFSTLIHYAEAARQVDNNSKSVNNNYEYHN